MFCTKCGNKLKEKDNFCPNCGKEIVKESIKEQENTTEKVNTVNNTVPQTPTKPPVNETNPVPFIIIGVAVIVGIIVFIFVLIFVILAGIFTAIDEYDYDYDYSGNNSLPDYREYYENPITDIIGGWENNDGSYFVFNKNKSFYWYKASTILNDNYYYGYLEILKGDNALKELGITEEKAKKVIENNENISKNNIYSIKLYPTYLLADGENKTNEKLKKGDNMKLLFVKLSNSKAEAYNFNSKVTFYLEKEEDTI